MKRRISHGQATRSTLMFLRVIHFIGASETVLFPLPPIDRALDLRMPSKFKLPASPEDTLKRTKESLPNQRSEAKLARASRSSAILQLGLLDRKSTRLNSSHANI